MALEGGTLEGGDAAPVNAAAAGWMYIVGGSSSGLITLLSFRFSARKKWSLLSTINGILCGGK